MCPPPDNVSRGSLFVLGELPPYRSLSARGPSRGIECCHRPGELPRRDDQPRISRQIGERRDRPFGTGSGRKRGWYYAGNYISLTPGEREGAVDAVTRNHMSTRTHAGALVLRWSFAHGWASTHGHAGVTTAEIATRTLSDVQDWSGTNRVDMDVAANDPSVPISMFFLDANGAGFITPARDLIVPNRWSRVRFDVPWPSGFDDRHVREFHILVSGIDNHRFGTLCVDNIQAVHEALPGAVSGLDFPLETFDSVSYDQRGTATPQEFNTFGGDWATIGAPSVRINPTLDLSVHHGAGAALRLSFRGLSPNTYAGMRESLFGATSDTAKTATSATSTAPREVSTARSASSLLGMRGWRPSLQPEGRAVGRRAVARDPRTARS